MKLTHSFDKNKGGSRLSSKQSNAERIQWMTKMALMLALAILLNIVESMIPAIPTLPPGVKLGLSNIVVMYCLFFLGKKEALMLAFLKSGFVLLARGGPIAFLMSFSGGLCSILIMIFLLSLKKRSVSYIIISICAAVAHNAAQLLVSALLLQNGMVFYYLPILVLSGVGMGFLTGITLRVLMPALGRLKRQ